MLNWITAFAAAGVLALSSEAFAQTPPDQPTAEQVAKARERVAKGEALFLMLKESSRCGAPVPKGYACALVLYKDISEDKSRDRLPASLVARVTGMTEADGTARDAKVRILSPFDARPLNVSPLQMPLFHMSLTSNSSGREMTILEMQAVLGYAENEARPKDDKRKIDRDRFKLPRENLNRY